MGLWYSDNYANYGQGTVCWENSVSGITLPASAAHIHEAPVTAPGPVVVPLFPRRMPVVLQVDVQRSTVS